MYHPKFSLLLMLTGAALGLGCANDSMPAGTTTEPQMSAGLLVNGLGKGLLFCSPSPLAVTTQTVGPEGGTLQIGQHFLTIPAGALTEAVEITAEAPSDSVTSVRLLPEGLVFAPEKPAILTLSYRNCSFLGQLAVKRIVYTTDQLEVLEVLPSMDDLPGRRVATQLEHFSRYAISW